MRLRDLRLAATLLALAAAAIERPLAQGSAPAGLPAPGFHHLHLNSINPDAAIDFYARQFPATSRTTFAGAPALRSPNNVLVLFTKVETPPATQPQSAVWHFGWYVTDVHKSLELYKQHAITLLPLYAEEGGGTVFTSADTWPSTGGGLGLTKAGIAEARANGVKPTFGAGFAYLQGPDAAIVEYQGNMASERFNHIHMFQEQPFCAQLWYQQHLGAPVNARGGQPRTEADCRVERGPDKTWPALEHNGMYRTPAVNGTVFGDVALFTYMNQTDQPLVSTRGHLVDHFALSVTDLDAWVAKLRRESVTFLEPPYRIGETRAVMIEGPSREAIEIIEIR